MRLPEHQQAAICHWHILVLSGQLLLDEGGQRVTYQRHFSRPALSTSAPWPYISAVVFAVLGAGDVAAAPAPAPEAPDDVDDQLLAAALAASLQDQQQQAGQHAGQEPGPPAAGAAAPEGAVDADANMQDANAGGDTAQPAASGFATALALAPNHGAGAAGMPDAAAIGADDAGGAAPEAAASATSDQQVAAASSAPSDAAATPMQQGDGP